MKDMRVKLQHKIKRKGKGKKKKNQLENKDNKRLLLELNWDVSVDSNVRLL